MIVWSGMDGMNTFASGVEDRVDEIPESGNTLLLFIRPSGDIRRRLRNWGTFCATRRSGFIHSGYLREQFATVDSIVFEHRPIPAWNALYYLACVFLAVCEVMQ